MRGWIIAAVVAVSVVAASVGGAAAPEPAPTPGDVAFRDIFAVLSTKVSRSSDQAFFENEVLQGHAVREANHFTHAPGEFEYRYGPGLAVPMSMYFERRDAGRLHIQFNALEFSRHSCLTFQQADDALRRQGWGAAKHLPSLGQDVMAQYRRAGVLFEISNVEDFTVRIEPWTSPEWAEEQRGRAEAARQNRIAMKPASADYQALCVDTVGVSFTR